MKYDLVVARYNEDVSWLSKELDLDKYKLFIYNKGDTNLTFPHIQQENLGGDAHAYVSHIVNNYQNLSDFCIFIQAHPFDHDARLLEKIINHADEEFVPLSDHICNESINGWYESLISRRPPEYPIYLLRDSAWMLLGKETPDRVIFAAGQQFIISKEIIHRRSLEFYQKILDRFQFDFLLPWHIERLWYTIWKIDYE